MRLGRTGGFSLVEVMVASVMFLAVAIGIVPVFIQSMGSNVAGFESTKGSNHSRSHLEALQQIPFNSAELEPTGESPRLDYFSLDTELWVPGQPPDDGSDPALWLRTTSVRQYHMSALDDGILDPDTEALETGADPDWIHLKEIEVRIQGERATPFGGPGRDLTFRILKTR
jgi:hypothetical protein